MNQINLSINELNNALSVMMDENESNATNPSQQRKEFLLIKCLIGLNKLMFPLL